MLDLIKYKYFRDTTQRTLIDFSIPQIADCLRERIRVARKFYATPDPGHIDAINIYAIALAILESFLLDQSEYDENRIFRNSLLLRMRFQRDTHKGYETTQKEYFFEDNYKLERSFFDSIYNQLTDEHIDLECIKEMLGRVPVDYYRAGGDIQALNRGGGKIRVVTEPEILKQAIIDRKLERLRNRKEKIEQRKSLQKNIDNLHDIDTSTERFIFQMSGCPLLKTSKYINRGSPPRPANDVNCRGMKMLGNDGNMYVSTPTYNGIYRWVLVSPKRKPKTSPKRKPKTSPKRKPKTSPKRKPKTSPKRKPKTSPKRK
jgi:hypothetical protein